jgi:EAL domain-containing protein (putative c-di-GMP-specific phosphodiesterase class I)
MRRAEDIETLPIRQREVIVAAEIVLQPVASLSYLKKFPLDGLKVDRSFVLELLAGSDDAAIVGSTINLSRQLGLSVIAEGIENRATADLLVSMGCEEGQGYFFGRPMPAQSFESQFLIAREASSEAHVAGQAA